MSFGGMGGEDKPKLGHDNRPPTGEERWHEETADDVWKRGQRRRKREESRERWRRRLRKLWVFGRSHKLFQCRKFIASN